MDPTKLSRRVRLRGGVDDDVQEGVKEEGGLFDKVTGSVSGLFGSNEEKKDQQQALSGGRRWRRSNRRTNRRSSRKSKRRSSRRR